MRKYLLPAIIVLALVGAIFYTSSKSSQHKLKLLPTKDNPTSTGLYTDIPPFAEWQWKERRAKEGNLVYRIKIPAVDNFVEGGEESLSSYPKNINITMIDRNCPGYICQDLKTSSSTNMEGFKTDNSLFFARKWFIEVGSSNIARYRTYLGKYWASDPIEDWQYVLTKKYLILVSYSNDPRCSAVSDVVRINHPFYLKQCLEYMQIYLLIVEKALSTLEIPDYIDDRGFATSSEIKLLPDELRVYEVI